MKNGDRCCLSKAECSFCIVFYLMYFTIISMQSGNVLKYLNWYSELP